jgi:hypothetical protein
MEKAGQQTYGPQTSKTPKPLWLQAGELAARACLSSVLMSHELSHVGPRGQVESAPSSKASVAPIESSGKAMWMLVSPSDSARLFSGRHGREAAGWIRTIGRTDKMTRQQFRWMCGSTVHPLSLPHNAISSLQPACTDNIPARPL